MFFQFILMLRQAGLKAGLHELLNLVQALDAGLAHDLPSFHRLCLSLLLKHESQRARFDAVFMRCFQQAGTDSQEEVIPEEWLKRELSRLLSEEDQAAIEAYGSLEDILKRFQELMKTQQARHQCGDTWIGTGGTSPFGAWGYNPAGIRIGQNKSVHQRAIKRLDVDQLPPAEEETLLQARHFQLALRQLRILARDGRRIAFDLPGTIRKTSRNAGLLELSYRPERQHHARLLLFLDWGGSMSPHARTCRQIAEAARAEFKDIRIFYFRNCLYDYVWTGPERKNSQRILTQDVFRQFGPSYRLIVLGDGSMSPSELFWPGGSMEHHNKQSGVDWIQLLCRQYPRLAWLSPLPVQAWKHSETTLHIQQLTAQRMFFLSVQGLRAAIRCLKQH